MLAHWKISAILNGTEPQLVLLVPFVFTLLYHVKIIAVKLSENGHSDNIQTMIIHVLTKHVKDLDRLED